MLFIVGLIIVLGCVGGGYMLNGGHLYVVWQPYEFLIILGAAVGGMVIGTPMAILKQLGGGGFGTLLGGTVYSTKKPYMDLLGFLFELSKLMRTKGIKEVEQQIDHPHDSALFQKYPIFSKDHHLEAFVCDNVRLIVMGSGMPNQLEELMDEELAVHHKERKALSDIFVNMADGMPALGIVAAVLGVIHTMGAITEPPEILGHLIGAALVGTFFGVLVAYGIVAPISKNLEAAFEAEGAFYNCVKVGIVNFARQLSPQMIAEFTRKYMPGPVRPSFQEAEEYLNSIGGSGGGS
jgi:chemotaxis protein MotA